MTKQNSLLTIPGVSRRGILNWSALMLGGLASSSLYAMAPEPQAAAPCNSKESGNLPIRQEVDFKASTSRVYTALIDSAMFAAFTGAPAEIKPEPGGTISCFGGRITGRNIELKPNQRIVQAWRVADWEEGLYSVVRFELKSQGNGTHLIFDHSAFPAPAREHLDGGWKRMYWEPLQKYLG
jgi:activator of HSP90 ATPase